MFHVPHSPSASTIEGQHRRDMVQASQTCCATTNCFEIDLCSIMLVVGVITTVRKRYTLLDDALSNGAQNELLAPDRLGFTELSRAAITITFDTATTSRAGTAYANLARKLVIRNVFHVQ